MEQEILLPPEKNRTTPLYIIYILYIAAIFTGLPMLLGVIVAYIYRDGAPDWLATHYRYQIRTFWVMFAWGALFLLLMPVMLPFLLPLLFLGLPIWGVFGLWVGLRCLVGMRALSERRPISNPATWLI